MKSYWNYRILQHKEDYFSIHEVYYTKGKPTSWTADPVDISGETMEDIFDSINLMGKCFLEPVLIITPDGKLIEGDKSFLFMKNKLKGATP